MVEHKYLLLLKSFSGLVAWPGYYGISENNCTLIAQQVRHTYAFACTSNSSSNCLETKLNEYLKDAQVEKFKPYNSCSV